MGVTFRCCAACDRHAETKKKKLCRGYREGFRGVMQKLKEAPATRDEDVMVTLRRGMRDAAEELGGGVRERGRGGQERG
jgi:hypothetical protein